MNISVIISSSDMWSQYKKVGLLALIFCRQGYIFGIGGDTFLPSFTFHCDLMSVSIPASLKATAQPASFRKSPITFPQSHFNMETTKHYPSFTMCFRPLPLYNSTHFFARLNEPRFHQEPYL